MAKPKSFSLRLSAFLFESKAANLEALLGVPLAEVEAITVSESAGVDGKIFVKRKPV